RKRRSTRRHLTRTAEWGPKGHGPAAEVQRCCILEGRAASGDRRLPHVLGESHRATVRPIPAPVTQVTASRRVLDALPPNTAAPSAISERTISELRSEERR